MRIGGQPGYEIRLEGQSMAHDTDVMVVQWMRFSGTGSIRMVGVSPKKDWGETFTRFPRRPRRHRYAVNARIRPCKLAESASFQADSGLKRSGMTRNYSPAPELSFATGSAGTGLRPPFETATRAGRRMRSPIT